MTEENWAIRKQEPIELANASGCFLAQSKDPGNRFLHGPFATSDEAMAFGLAHFNCFEIRRVWGKDHTLTTRSR